MTDTYILQDITAIKFQIWDKNNCEHFSAGDYLNPIAVRIAKFGRSECNKVND